MADQRQLQKFLEAELLDPDLEIAPEAASRLGAFDLDLLDRLPAEERTAVVAAFLAGLPPRPPGPPPIPGDQPFEMARAIRRIEAQDIGNASASLKRLLDARGLDTMSPQARTLFLSCDCWPF